MSTIRDDNSFHILYNLTSIYLVPSCSSFSSHRASNKTKGSLFEIPYFDMNAVDFVPEKLEPAYRNFQILHLRHTSQAKRGSKKRLCWEDLGAIFGKLDDKDKETWCIETKGDQNPTSPNEFLVPIKTDDRAYCSFLIQHTADLYKKTLDRLPFGELPSMNWTYEPALWVFFGRNPLGNVLLEGRPDHTDSVTHDGTFHFQLSGEKRWSLRPTAELVSHVNERFPDLTFSQDSRLRLVCKEGDVIVINTRMWFHCTTIPPQTQPSVSYARDFRFSSLSPSESTKGGMKNVDGLYATNDIEEGTILFTEADMPDCELHRSSTDPNCEENEE